MDVCKVSLDSNVRHLETTHVAICCSSRPIAVLDSSKIHRRSLGANQQNMQILFFLYKRNGYWLGAINGIALFSWRKYKRQEAYNMGEKRAREKPETFIWRVEKS